MKRLITGLLLVMLLVSVSCAQAPPAGPPEPPVPPTTPEPITVEPEKDSLPIDLDVSDYPRRLRKALLLYLWNTVDHGKVAKKRSGQSP